jgi:hypothetical protein
MVPSRHGQADAVPRGRLILPAIQNQHAIKVQTEAIVSQYKEGIPITVRKL